MQFVRHLAYLTLIIASTLIIGCGVGPDAQNSAAANASANNAKTASTNKANTNAEELGMLVNFSWETEDLVWKKDDAKKTLIAAFRLSPEDVKKLSDQLLARSPGAPKEVTIEEWFPAELIAQGESGGGSSVEGTAFPGDDLYQAPYEQGTISRINGTDFFVIELNAK